MPEEISPVAGNASRSTLKKILKSQLPVLILITLALLIAGALINRTFLAATNIGNILALSALLGFVAAGQTLVILSGGEGIDLSVGSVMSFGGILAAWFMDGKDMNILPALLIVLAAGAVFGLTNAAGTILARIPPLVMTLAMTNVIASLQQLFTGGYPKGVPAPLVKEIGSGRLLPFLPWLAVFWIFEIVLITFLLRRTSFGHQLYATGNNFHAAYLSGVKGNTIKTIAYVLCGVFSAFAGFCLCAYTGIVYVNAAMSYIMPSIAAVVIGGTSLAGGKGSYFGTVLGVIILTVLNSLLVMLNTDEVGRLIINGLLLILLLAVYTRQPPIRQ